MTNNTDQTKAAIDLWQEEKNKEKRYAMLMQLAQDAGLYEEFSTIPKIHFDVMDHNKFMINVLALGKIRELRQIGKKKRGFWRR